MWKIFANFSNRRFSTLTSTKKSASVLSKVELASKMKEVIARKEYQHAIDLFEKQPQAIGDASISQFFKACGKQGDLDRARKMHRKLSTNSLKNPFILSSLIHAYMELDDPLNAERVFSKSSEKSSSMYAAMIKGLMKNQMANKAIELFQTMSVEATDIVLMGLFNACAQVGDRQSLAIGRQALAKTKDKYSTNTYFLTSALNMFIKCDDMISAEQIFAQISDKTVIKYGAMMKGYNQHGQPLKTVSLFDQMKKDSIVPNQIIFTLLIDACSMIGIRSWSQRIVEQIPPAMLSVRHIQNGLIDMMGKCGRVDEAQRIFQSVTDPDIITYTAMIHAFGLNGEGGDAVKLFDRVPPEMANEWTYVAALNACSHTGQINEARAIFSKIKKKTAKIYTAMIDCLCRLFLFDEAQRLVQKFEESHSPDPVMYMVILSGARNEKNSSLSNTIFNEMKRKFPSQTDRIKSASILVANTFSSSGDLDKASTIKRKVYQDSVKRKIGISWTEAGGELVQFSAHDRSHRRSSEILEETQRMLDDLIQHGYKPDSSWITRPIGKNETVESVLCGHSERLALAFNFIQETIPSPIQITKNLRVCGDCHHVTKLIAKIRQVEIIVRDANRFHHFSPDGKCSCRDHF